MCHVHQYRGLAATALFLLASCISPDAGPTASRVIRPDVWAAKGGPPPSDSVRLGMTVNDAAAFQIGSDSLGEYVDGAGGMRAVIDAPGNLQITPMNANNSTPPRVGSTFVTRRASCTPFPTSGTSRFYRIG